MKHMIFDYEVFRKRIKYLRELRGYSKYQFSIQANIHYQYYCNIENGKKIPNFKAVIAIANALNTDLSTLISDVDVNIGVENDLIISIASKLQRIVSRTLQQKFYNIIVLLKMREQKK